MAGRLFQAMAAAALAGSTVLGVTSGLLATLTAQDAHKTAHRVLLPARRGHDLVERHTLGPLHQRDDLGFWFVGAGCALFRAVSRLLTLGGEPCSTFPWAGPAGARRATACQIRATAVWRFVNFLTGFRSSKWATLAKLFQTSIRQGVGQFLYGRERL